MAESALDRPLDAPPKRTRKAGTVERARLALWRAVTAAEGLLYAPDVTPAMVLRTCHALSQAVGAYGRLVETAELERRIADLEERMGYELGDKPGEAPQKP